MTPFYLPQGKLCTLFGVHSAGKSEVLLGYGCKPTTSRYLASATPLPYLVYSTVTSHLLALSDGIVNTSTEIVWNSEPKNIGKFLPPFHFSPSSPLHPFWHSIDTSSAVYMAPYMLAFTSNSIEIRKADNGSLMQTINAPDVHMFSHKV